MDIPLPDRKVGYYERQVESTKFGQLLILAKIDILFLKKKKPKFHHTLFNPFSKCLTSK